MNSRLLVLGRAVVIAGALAAGPTVTESAEPPAQPSVSPAQTAAPVAGKPGTKVLVDDSVTDAQLKQILAKGYKPESQARGHEVYYCRRETDLGSRFETRVCRTAARILQEEQQGKEATTNVEQTPGTKAGK